MLPRPASRCRRRRLAATPVRRRPGSRRRARSTRSQADTGSRRPSALGAGCSSRTNIRTARGNLSISHACDALHALTQADTSAIHAIVCLAQMVPAPGQACATAEDLTAFLRGGLAPAAAGGLEAHIADCGDCRQLLSALVKAETAAGAIDPALSAALADTFG